MTTQAGWILVAGLMLGLVACGSDASSGSTSSMTAIPDTTSTMVPITSSTTVPTAVPTTETATVPIEPFPTAVFAPISDDPVAEGVAAKFQAALDGLVGGGGLAATVMTPEGSWSGAAGTADGVDEMQPESQFGIASGTKPIIAAQVMLLVETGEVSLDTPAIDYLPADFTFDTNGATIRQLLSHRSGIPGWYSDAMEERIATDRSRVWELDEILAYVPAARRPVGSFEYADTNYNLLGLVIEQVRQQSLVEVLRDGVLRVDGTERLIYQPEEAPTDPMAMPRGESRAALEWGAGYLPSISEVSAAGPAGAMASDSISFARWWRAFCAGEIVSDGSLTEMSTFYDNADIDYGLALMNPADGYAQGVGHLGADFGYNSWSACLTEDQMIVVVLTYSDADLFNLGRPLVVAARSD